MPHHGKISACLQDALKNIFEGTSHFTEEHLRNYTIAYGGKSLKVELPYRRIRLSVPHTLTEEYLWVYVIPTFDGKSYLME
jgi:hypothetical protein